NPLSEYIIMGELSLDGNLQPIRGALPIALKAKVEGFKGFILPKQNAREAAIVEGIDVLGIENIKEVIDFFNENIPLEKTEVDIVAEFYAQLEHPVHDFADVRGQESIKPCMKIAAPGRHNTITSGRRGSGNTMQAKHLSSILPRLHRQDS